MLDTKGIYLDEVNRKYPSTAQSLGYDVLLDVDGLYKPRVISTFELAVNAILTLLVMKPGQYPSIPELGIDIESYLFEYADDQMIPAKIKEKLQNQCNRLDITGLDYDVYIDQLNDGTNALVITIQGTDVTYVNGKRENRPIKLLVGISYDKLNQVYVRKRYIEKGASL